MNILTILLIIIYSVIGGLSTIYLLLSMPAVIIWKCYRNIKYHIPLKKHKRVPSYLFRFMMGRVFGI